MTDFVATLVLLGLALLWLVAWRRRRPLAIGALVGVAYFVWLRSTVGPVVVRPPVRWK